MPDKGVNNHRLPHPGPLPKGEGEKPEHRRAFLFAAMRITLMSSCLNFTNQPVAISSISPDELP